MTLLPFFISLQLPHKHKIKTVEKKTPSKRVILEGKKTDTIHVTWNNVTITFWGKAEKCIIIPLYV
jgi:hypothetical protein